MRFPIRRALSPAACYGVAFLGSGLARQPLGRPLKHRRARTGLDHVKLRTFECYEQVIGGPRRAKRERARTIWSDRVAPGPVGGTPHDHAVYADRRRRDSEGAVPIEVD